MSNTAYNNNLFNSLIIGGMHKSMERLYYAAKTLKGIAIDEHGHKSSVAKLLNVSSYTINNWENRGISKDGMIKAEAAIGCAASWLETGHGNMIIDPSKMSAAHKRDRGEVPLLSWIQAGHWTDTTQGFDDNDAEDWIQCPAKHGPRAFCLRVRGISMYNPQGKYSFSQNDIILVDPDRQPINESFVVAHINNQTEATFKMLIIDGDKKYLKAINPAWPEQIIELKDDATICGVVSCKWTLL
jgi:SOS-response transcriptional repressor LexA